MRASWTFRPRTKFGFWIFLPTFAGKMTQKYPFLAGVKVPANTYKGQTADVSTVAVNAVLIAGNQLKDDMVYNLTKALSRARPSWLRPTPRARN